MDEENLSILQRLLDSTVYIIDYLPMTVPKDGAGLFFDVEYYLLNSSKKTDIKNRFTAVIHKLMCYYRMDVLWGQWEEKAPPERIDKIIDEIMENSSGELNCVFPDIDMLLVFSWDSLNIDIYNPPEDVMELLDKIASSEGLFFRKSVNE